MLANRISGLFPPGVAVAAALAQDEAVDESFHVKHPSVAHAVPARKQEFAAGRRAAEQAQVALGLVPRTVAMGTDRAPVWPPGLCGSISHAAGVCVAAVARDRELAALGLDIEVDRPLPEGVAESVFGNDELRRLHAMADPAQMEILAFAAKEAVYKAQYPLTRQILGFEALDVTITPDDAQFEARFTADVGAYFAGSVITGCYDVHAGLVVCAVALGRHGRRP